MSYGYSARVVKLNKQASKSRLGVKLGRLCIALDIPTSEVAKAFGISKQTVYNWFMGTHDPKDKAEAVAAYIKKHS
jgi:DNA-binding transcriptional regulator YiaG